MRQFGLDIRYGYDDMLGGIDPSRHIVSADHQALYQAYQDIRAGRDRIRVGESGTLLRVLDHVGVSLGHDWEFECDGTLNERPVTRARDTVGMRLPEMLLLDNGSSQHASGAVLAGNSEPMPVDAPYHLRMTYEAMAHWYQRRWSGNTWEPRADRTLYRHGVAFLGYVMTGEMQLEPIQAEDYPLARTFELMTPEDALDRGWTSLIGHESNRIESVDHANALAEHGEIVPYADHRILQALRMKYGLNVRFEHPEAIAKTWPLISFNRFLIGAQQYAT